MDEWLVAADPTAVSSLIRRVEHWPTWWPSVRSVKPVEAKGRGATWRFTFSTRLPYAMIFDAEVLQDDPLVGVEARVTGRVTGAGRWSVCAIDGGSKVRFDWQVVPQMRWMQLLSPVARPVFGWNHKAIMVEGGDALARRLQTQLLGPVVSRLLAG